LYLVSDPIAEKEISGLQETIRLMADCIVAFRERYWQGFYNMNTTILTASSPPCLPLTKNLSGGENKKPD